MYTRDVSHAQVQVILAHTSPRLFQRRPQRVAYLPSSDLAEETQEVEAKKDHLAQLQEDREKHLENARQRYVITRTVLL